MSRYPISRIILSLVQALGWVLAAIGILLGSLQLAHHDKSGIVTMISFLFGGALNHALISIGLAIFDIADNQREQLDAQYGMTKTIRDRLPKTTDT